VSDPDLRPLIEGWAGLRLAVAAPERVPFWDHLVLTASGPAQAAVYRRECERLRRGGRIPDDCAVHVIDDPEGRRIGSGGATLHVLRELRAADPDLDRRRVILVHAGGDSRRLPWASLPGKAFVPVPLLADPDREAPSLLEHCLALSAPLAAGLESGLLVLAGDVLPLVDLAAFVPPADQVAVLTLPVPLDVASRHGVIVADDDGRVRRLLQKQPSEVLLASDALVDGAAALLDTGVIALRGKAFAALAMVAAGHPEPVARLLEKRVELSLYEEVLGALVPAEREAVRRHPLGAELVAGFDGHRLHHHRDDAGRFFHLGTSAEYLDFVDRDWSGLLGRRILTAGGRVHERATCLTARLAERAAVGAGSVVHGCDLGEGVAIGGRCTVIGVHHSGAFALPDHCCWWQVAHGEDVVVDCVCGVDDRPKDVRDATFCGRDLGDWLAERGVAVEDVWDADDPRDLWHARLFAPREERDDDGPLTFLIHGGDPAAWLARPRHSLADLAGFGHADAGGERLGHLRETLAESAMALTWHGDAEHNLRALGAQCERPALAELLIGPPSARLPASRRAQLEGDRAALHAGEDDGDAVRDAVATQVAAATVDPPEAEWKAIHVGRTIEAELPVRLDLAGGWTDTPPWCCEHPGLVCNLAALLDGRAPIRARVRALDEPVLRCHGLDGGERAEFDAAALAAPTAPGDPHHLALHCLALCGFGDAGGIHQGVEVETGSRVPRGSGLGTSSILAAALITALQGLAGRPADPQTVSRLVLVLEQLMATGGGWQDQLGGLHPGAKLIASWPTRPLRLEVQPIPLTPAVRDELEARLVLVWTGRERLAKDVLQKVVRAYCQRDAVVVATLRRLRDLAADAQRALALGRFADLARVVDATWRAHQQLDPHCSTPELDRLIARARAHGAGVKLAGAGGGGFLLALAPDARRAEAIGDDLAAHDPRVRVHRWSLA